MDSQKTGKAIKPVILIILIALLTCVIGFAVGGWSSGDTVSANAYSENNDNFIQTAQPQSNSNDEEKDKTVFFDTLTGEETEESLARQLPVAVLFEGTTRCSGLKNADITVEFPIENGQTRFLALMKNTQTLGKIGPITTSKDYIDVVASSFGAIAISFAEASTVSKKVTNRSTPVLLLSNSGQYAYKEKGEQTYTNGYLLASALSDFDLSTEDTNIVRLPFSFYEEETIADKVATSLILPFSADNKTELLYKADTEAYRLCKNGTEVSDPLTTGCIEYDNVITLFVSATTYETSDGVQTVLDTLGEGCGYCFSKGAYRKIQYKADDDGIIHYLETDGQPLLLNRGRTYIAYVKSSLKSQITIN